MSLAPLTGTRPVDTRRPGKPMAADAATDGDGSGGDSDCGVVSVAAPEDSAVPPAQSRSGKADLAPLEGTSIE